MPTSRFTVIRFSLFFPLFFHNGADIGDIGDLMWEKLKMWDAKIVNKSIILLTLFLSQDSPSFYTRDKKKERAAFTAPIGLLVLCPFYKASAYKSLQEMYAFCGSSWLWVVDERLF